MIKIVRNSGTGLTTSGWLFFDGEYVCHTLEDIMRHSGIKVQDATAIPSGIYKGKITYSNRFKRNMILIYNQDDKSVDRDGVKFTGIRIHGGNTHKDTSGCILAAYNKVNDDTIQGTAEKAITQKCYDKYGYEEFLIEIVDNF